MAVTVDKEFVSKLLGEPLQDLFIAPGSKLGDNVAGDLLSLVATTSTTRKVHLVHKSMVTDDPFVHNFLVVGGMFRIENALYSTIVPTMARFAELRGAPQVGQLPVPHFYGGFNDDNNDYLCLQDMRPDGFIMPDKWTGLDLPETELIMKELARFHALAYALIRWEGEKFFESHPDCKRLIRQIHEQEIEMARVMPDIIRNSADLIGRSDPMLGEHVLNAQGGGQLSDMFGTALLTDSKFFATLVHGDLWVNNILIKRDDQGAPVELCFIDFQQCHRGNIFEDLQYFFFTSTTSAFRRRHLSTVLDAYYDSFCATLDRLAFPLPVNFSRGFFVDNFRDCYLAAYSFICFAIPLQLGAPMSFEDVKPVTEDGNIHLVNGDNGGPPPACNATHGSDQPSTGLTQAQMEMKMLVNSCKLRMEKEPRAIKRLTEITREMVELKVI